MTQRKRFGFALVGITLLLGLASRRATAQTYTDLHDFNCAVEGCNPNYPSVLAQGRDGNLYGTTTSGGAYGKGSVFKVTPGGALTTLYNFDTTTGANPRGGLTLATDGNFYGTTQAGGASNYGTIFRITPAGVLTVLHEFSGADGGVPYAPPIQASNASLYGLTQIVSRAYRITLAGKFTLISAPQWVASFAPLMQAADGYLYGTNRGGSQYGLVLRMSLAGAFQTVYTFDTTHGAQPYGPVTQASDGFLYGTTWAGGAHNFGVAFKLTTKGVLTSLYDFAGASDGRNPSAGLVAASDRNLYGGATTGGASGNGTLFSLTRSGTFSLLYSFDGTHGAHPYDSMMQHTTGTIYGLTTTGGANGDGVLFSLDVGAPQFVALLTILGRPGQTVQILGQGFRTASSVSFGKGSADFIVVSDTYMKAVVPDEGTPGYVTVTTGSGTLNSNNKFRVMPVIRSFDPTQGPPGTQVTITGGGFHGATKVTFGGVTATSFSVDSGSQITATVPSGAVTGKIKVTTPGGTAASKGIFTVT